MVILANSFFDMLKLYQAKKPNKALPILQSIFSKKTAN